jgi:hypothetical protein
MARLFAGEYQECNMKPVWIGIVFFFVYGLFSIKSHASEAALDAPGIFAEDACR